jgi:hypothetical protein
MAKGSQQPRYNTDQGMNNDPWGNRDLNNLAGNGGGGQQPQQANPWDVQQDNRGLQGFGASINGPYCKPALRR